MKTSEVAQNGAVVNGVALPNGHSKKEAPATNGATNGAPVEHADVVENGTPVDIAVALAPNNVDAVPSLLKEISSFSEDLSGNNRQIYKPRIELLAKARSLVQALETPRETMIKHCWAQPAAYAAINVGIDIGLFALMAKSGWKSRTVDDLAKELNVNSKLLGRVMRHIGTMGYIVETGRDEYKPTNFSNSLTIPIIGDGYPCLSDGCFPAVYKFHQYLANNGYNAEIAGDEGSYQCAFNTKLNFFQYLQANQPLGGQFNHHMGGYRQGRPSWMDDDFYPVQERLIKGADADADSVFLVDMGGSIGHDIDELRQKHPDAPGRLVLQDLQIVIDQIKELDEKIERMPHDFLTEQPIKGARAYYMHSVLHDWPDNVCLDILSHVTAAMKPGYSKVLINENCIPDTDADWQATALDIMMMTLLSAEERTAQHWHRLLGSAGLKIVKIWNAESGVESLIECELA